MRFVFDLDGTICFKGQPISDRLVKSIDGLVENGHEIIFASARPIRDMLPVVNEKFHNYFLIGGNGSLVSKEGENIHVNSFSSEQIKAIMSLIKEYQATYLIDSDWDYSYTGATDHPILNNLDILKIAKRIPIESLNKVVKVLILSSTNAEELSEKLVPLDVVIHKHSNENLIDISPKNIHKWSALQKIGTTEKGFIAFGNDANDITMFKEACYSVRIGNHEELGKYADETISLEGDYEQKIIDKLEELSFNY